MPRVREEVRGVRLDIRMLFFWLSRGPRRKSIRDASVKIIAMEALRRAQERMWRHLKAFFLLVVLAKPIKRRQLRLLSEGLSGAQRNASEGLHFRGSIATSIPNDVACEDEQLAAPSLRLPLRRNLRHPDVLSVRGEGLR